MFPYLLPDDFRRRSMMPLVEATGVEESNPGFTAARIAIQSSYINGRLRKRYGNNGAQNSLPLGQTAPAFVKAGTAAPDVSLQGRPTWGSMLLRIEVTLGGALGTAQFRWSSDGGVTWVTGVLTSASVVLGATGLSATFASGVYSTDNVYAAASPVPEIVLGWLTTLVTDDLYRKRGRDPQDPAMVDLRDDVTRTLGEIKEAADSKDGLFDLPVSEDLDSAVTTGGPLGYSETSPYVWPVIEKNVGQAEDIAVGAAVGLDR